MAPPVEFVVLTPTGKSWSREVHKSVSAARRHAAKRQHARQRIHQSKSLINAMNHHENPILSTFFVGTETMVTAQAANYTDESSADKIDAFKHSGHIEGSCNEDSCETSPGEDQQCCSFPYRPEPSFFGPLQLRTRREKDDVVHYLQMIPSMAAGPSRDDRFQPLRDVCSHALQSSPVVVDWLLLEMEGIRSIHDPTMKSVMYARRKRVYRLMNKMLADPAQRCSDDLLNMVFGATCIEYRTANGMDVSAVRVHCRGLQRLIELHGGLASLFSVAATLSHPIYCLGYFQYSELEVANRFEARHCCESFMDTLQDIQASVLNSGCSMIDCQGNFHLILKYFVHRRRQTDLFGERVAQFLSLYLVALMIWDLSPDYRIIDKLLSRLSLIIDDRINSTTGAAQLTPHMLVWMVAAAWVDVDASSIWHGSGPQKEVWITQAGIDALKVYGRLPDKRKLELTNILIGCLCQNCDDSAHDSDWQRNHPPQPLDLGYLSQITEECCSGWYEEYITLEQLVTSHGGDET